jgi:hypothetical protein
MSAHKQKAILLGLIGLVLIVLGVKYMPVFAMAAAGQQRPAGISDGPVLLFFNLDDPCECMVEMTQSAEQQMADWPEERRGGIAVMRLPMGQRKDIEAIYEVSLSPALVLIDAQGQVALRLYPMNEGEPFALEEMEAAIAELGTK